MENAEEYGYFAKDVAMDIDITTSTLRRWSIELEKAGYHFQRNEKEQRIYYERDFKVFREIKKFLGNQVPFVDAIKSVVSMDLSKKNASKTPSVKTDELRLSRCELEEIVNRAVKTAVEEEREKMFQMFEKKLNNTLERRDNFFIEEMRREQEERKVLIEEVAAVKEKEKKPFWKRLFGG
ncbi:MerR family transcriptional regulator [Cytobacillus sp. Sa5YUA1]|uniref:MerR family transcriptional regulator n=1 Tax=Cytobacillus stercorigallinarum TaxID=2762240 RepID=A0ABR8QVV6_9BACI|nr:MerR family transcriptional regulator [Cytobacillus stercorigallinarum]MBD7939638.1 MerR family transcriptional regulator [Cytobacillus stercorigallinarum]